jgi:hypothetical protein
MAGIIASIDTKRNVLLLELPLQKPEPSSSGKTLVVASTHGNVETDVEVQGRKVKVGVNAYIKPV